MVAEVLIPFGSGLLFQPMGAATMSRSRVLIPFGSGLLFQHFGRRALDYPIRLNPLWFGSPVSTEINCRVC